MPDNRRTEPPSTFQPKSSPRTDASPTARKLRLTGKGVVNTISPKTPFAPAGKEGQ